MSRFLPQKLEAKLPFRAIIDTHHEDCEGALEPRGVIAGDARTWVACHDET